MKTTLIAQLLLGLYAGSLALSFVPLGCFRDNTNDRDLNGTGVRPVLMSDNMTVESCVGLCNARAFQYAGLQFSHECFCGNSYGRYGIASSAECIFPCKGNASQTCGGAERNSVYQIGGATTVPTTATTAAPTTSATTAATTVTTQTTPAPTTSRSTTVSSAQSTATTAPSVTTATSTPTTASSPTATTPTTATTTRTTATAAPTTQPTPSSSSSTSSTTATSATPGNPCNSSPCAHGGTCAVDGSRYSCTCTGDYAGPDCTQARSCNSTFACENNGTCESGRCRCANMFTGERCDFYCNGASTQSCKCAGNPCGNGGNCIEGSGGIKCVCASGFSGLYCDKPVVPTSCQSQPCMNGGTCTPSASGFTCNCAPGSTGPTCGEDVNECTSSPCLNGGSCVNGPPSTRFRCECKQGFGGELCREDINECDRRPKPCFNNGTCNNQLGSYSCNCSTGYEGTYCKHEKDECQSLSCNNNGTCIDLIARAVCNCVYPWVGNTCNTNDSASLNGCSSSPCRNGTCINVGGGRFTCACPRGLTGDRCETVLDLCLSSPCTNGSTCRNSNEGYRCDCPPNRAGFWCELVGACPSNCLYFQFCNEKSPDSEERICECLTRSDCPSVTQPVTQAKGQPNQDFDLYLLIPIIIGGVSLILFIIILAVVLARRR